MTYLKATLCLLSLVGGWLLFLSSLSAAIPQVWYVSTLGTDSNSCSSPDAPCATVEAVLALPDFQDGDTIYVVEGLYEETEGAEQALLITRDVTIWGGWNEDFTAEGTHRSAFNGIPRTGIVVESGITVVLKKVAGGGGEYDPSLDNHSEYLYCEICGATNAVGGILNYGNLTLEGSSGYGSWGYGIQNNGVLTMTNSIVSDVLFGTGIINNGDLKMIDSHIEYAGIEAGCASLENRGTLYMEGSSIRNGEVQYGVAGLCNYGIATIAQSLFRTNRANGPWPDYGFGAIANYGTLTVTNSAIFGNTGMFESASGIYNTGELYLANTSIAGNGDDLDLVSVGGSVYTRNSLIENCTGSITSDGYNLLAHSEGCDWHSAAGDLFDQDPFVASLLKPRIGSPLINHGNPDGCEAWDGTPLDSDKDGSPRWQECDIGAYEYVPPAGEIFTRHLPFVEHAIIE